MADFANGAYKVLYIKVGEVYFPIGCLTSNSFSEEVAMLGTTTRDNSDGWKTSIPTLQSYNISFDGIISRQFRSRYLLLHATCFPMKYH